MVIAHMEALERRKSLQIPSDTIFGGSVRQTKNSKFYSSDLVSCLAPRLQ